MKNHYLTVGLVLLMACGQEEGIPNSVLAPEQMVPILVDMHQADAKVGNLRIEEDSAYTVMRHFELFIYDKYGISEEKYLNSKQWYLSHPDVYTEVYNVVVDSLRYLEETVREKPRTNQRDSSRTVDPEEDEQQAMQRRRIVLTQEGDSEEEEETDPEEEQE